MGFWAYLETPLAGDWGISRLVATASLADSDDDPDAPSNVESAESLRKRPIPFPARELFMADSRYWRRAPDSAGVQYLGL